MRVAILTEIASPYRIPLFNALAKRPEIDLTVLLLSRSDPRRTYPFYAQEFAFDWLVLPGWELHRGLHWVVLTRGLRRELRRLRPDVIVAGGWNQPAYWRAILWTRRHRTPLVLWVESTARDARSGSGPLESAKRFAIRSASAFLVPGRAAAEYLESLGVEPGRIQVAPNAVDLRLLARQVEAARARRDELRAELGLSGCVFLCVSRLSHEKGVDVLARAFHGVSGQLVLAGGGPDRALVEAAAPEGTRLLGNVPRDELPRWYAAADAFVMPSRSETWGMAMNEAAAAGLPLVASEAPGAGYELIEPGVNGFRVPVGDESALREALRRVADDERWRARAVRRTLELARGHTPEAWADAVASLARRLAASSP
ncbi:MAG: glycosyltransferase family 4 protein [Gaiellaceae bacterium]